MQPIKPKIFTRVQLEKEQQKGSDRESQEFSEKLEEQNQYEHHLKQQRLYLSKELELLQEKEDQLALEKTESQQILAELEQKRLEALEQERQEALRLEKEKQQRLTQEKQAALEAQLEKTRLTKLCKQQEKKKQELAWLATQELESEAQVLDKEPTINKFSFESEKISIIISISYFLMNLVESNVHKIQLAMLIQSFLL